jgi:hypothetical protein
MFVMNAVLNGGKILLVLNLHTYEFYSVIQFCMQLIIDARCLFKNISSETDKDTFSTWEMSCDTQLTRF